jgi:glutathione peroxidase
MKTLISVLLLMVMTTAQAKTDCPDWLQQDLQKLHSSDKVNLCELAAGKVALIVNTASDCGYTPQFKGLETLYKKYKDDGLVIIGFPSDSFNQERADAKETAEVCYINYGVTFPMLAASPVKGKDANPVFQHLNAALEEPKWNFNKYLVDRSGKPVKHFGSHTEPDDKELTAAIEGLLKPADWLPQEMKKLHSSEMLNLRELAAGKVTLIVNTASDCGYTPQFKGLEALYQQYKEKGFVIIGFPSDSFFQERNDAAETAEVCYLNYGVSFPMVESSSVLGGKTNPVFKHLKAELGMPRWNFNKYLVDRSGKPVERFGSTTKPDDKKLITAIEALL